MKTLLVGNGAREHAIAWKLAQSPLVSELIVAPGNAGTAALCRNVPIGAEDVDGLLALARSEGVEFTVIGPEAPLAAGIVDRFQEAGLLVFGPTAAAARIESSKSFAKDLMLRHGIPTARAEVFTDYGQALEYLVGTTPPVVVKADGLAAGKGVVVASTLAVARDALRRQMVELEFGDAGRRVLIEECLEGQEISVFAFVDGEEVSTLAAACDYKRALDGDEGPNTGGMGAYSPPATWSEELELEVRERIMAPAAKALAALGSPFRGILYGGLMLTSDGPKVIEFNCRLGDPEAQVVLPRLKTDLAAIMIGTATGNLEGLSLEWDERACVGVALASGGYPGAYQVGREIRGLDGLDEDAMVFHAGTRLEDDAVVTDGGRVLTVCALGEDLAAARERAYHSAGRISFEGAQFRRDIAAEDAPLR